MTRTFIRQDNQILSSDVYDDTIAPSLADFETNPTHIEADLNNHRSMLSHLLDVQAGNWYDVISTPSTLEAGVQRGVSNLNNALHLMEKKRVLRDVCTLVDVTVPASVTAISSIVTDVQANYTDAQTFTLTDSNGQSITFEFDTVPNGVGGGNTAVDISADVTADNVRDTIISAINGVAGTLLITAGNGGAGVVSLTQDVGGAVGNTVIGTTGGPPGTFNAFTGGAGDVAILGAGQLPTQTTAAVGAVTTLGTIVAAHTGTFGTHSLDEVAGPNATSAKNLMRITDNLTHDPLISSGQIIYGLLQGESGVTDGATITDTTTTRVQISFVRIDPIAGDSLVPVPASDIAGQTFHYCYRERVRLEDLTETDFLRGAIVDLPAGTTVSRQVSYDNQGATPVNLTTNATLDLEAPGAEWQIRDDLEAILFRVIEGSAGGTSEVELSGDVDIFDNNALANDFATGATINTDGTRPIAVGETDGVIESTAGDLRINGANELFLDDVNQTGSTWAQTDGIKLSETTAEWDAFELAFGETSLLDAIIQAGQNAARTKVQAVVTVTRAPDTNINGPVLAGAASLDVNLPPYDQVTFVTDVDVFYNGSLLRGGANAAANEDVYPGTTPAQGDLAFEFTIKASPGNPDVITVIVNGQ
jgi:hypothetical protein